MDRARGRDALRVGPSITIPAHALEERFLRAPGPGGQHVNKVETAVQLRLDLARCPAIPAPIRERLERLAGRRLGADGTITIEAHRFRSRERNREDARERLAALVLSASTLPAKRRATRPPPRARRERLADKRRQAALKRLRARPGEE